MNIQRATTDEQILSCLPVIKTLRPHLNDEEFLPQIRRQEEAGYHLIYLADDTGPVAAAGYRLLENLAWGKILYLDDLICHPESRCRGYAGALLDWLHAKAKDSNCAQLHLDSGHQRFDAHRLYLKKGMSITSHHFSRPLT